jgi:hypothetical protein
MRPKKNAASLMLLLIWLGGSPVGLAQSAAPKADERGAAAATGVRGVFGNEQGLVTHGIEPLGGERPMRTVDGQAFDAALSCRASEQFLRVTMMPTGSDIGRFVVDLDANLDGSADQRLNFTGPFGGVCSNGVIGCAAGSWDDCHFYQWDTSGSTLALTEVSSQQLGACYCFNASCGNNLLAVNSQKVVSDLGTSVLTAAQQILPRVASTRTVADALSIQFIGQQGSCGTDDSPEQYFRRPHELAGAGLTALATPGTIPNFISNTTSARERGIASLRCEINRSIGANEVRKADILNFLSASRGHVQDCGAGCLRFLLGQAGSNYYGDNERCTVFEESLRLEVLRPDRISAFRLYRATYDDHIVLAQGSQVLYSRIHSLNWPDPVNGLPQPVPSFLGCERGDDWDLAPNVNLLPALQSVGTHALRLRTAVGGEGDSALYFEARVNESCELGAEEIVDGCTAAAANSRCRLKNEWVDGVQTVAEYLTTGLGPLASSRMVGASSSCVINTGNRAWWRTEREYDCLTEAAAPLDLSAAAERYQSIHTSIDLASGAFTDRVRHADGSYQTLAASVPVLTERGSAACTPTCRTRKPRPGANVAISGPTTAQNVTGVAWDFSFKDCESGTCPVEAGEEVVGACDCHNNFAQAVALMQTIRMVAEDTSCEVPQ